MNIHFKDIPIILTKLNFVLDTLGSWCPKLRT